MQQFPRISNYFVTQWLLVLTSPTGIHLVNFTRDCTKNAHLCILPILLVSSPSLFSSLPLSNDLAGLGSAAGLVGLSEVKRMCDGRDGLRTPSCRTVSRIGWDPVGGVEGTVGFLGWDTVGAGLDTVGGVVGTVGFLGWPTVGGAEGTVGFLGWATVGTSLDMVDSLGTEGFLGWATVDAGLDTVGAEGTIASFEWAAVGGVEGKVAFLVWATVGGVAGTVGFLRWATGDAGLDTVGAEGTVASLGTVGSGGRSITTARGCFFSLRAAFSRWRSAEIGGIFENMEGMGEQHPPIHNSD